MMSAFIKLKIYPFMIRKQDYSAFLQKQTLTEKEQHEKSLNTFLVASTKNGDRINYLNKGQIFCLLGFNDEYRSFGGLYNSLCSLCVNNMYINSYDAINIHYEGHWKGWVLKLRLAWALKWQRVVKRVPFGPKKVKISGPTPSIGLSNGFARIKIIKSKRHIKTGTLVNNRYHTLIVITP
jgi:hypothetical protein